MARSGKIPFWVKFNFGFGQIGEAAFSAITLTFMSLYYNQGLGLNIDLVGWAFILRLIGTFVAIFFYSRYRLSKAEHSEIRAELEEREKVAQAVQLTR